MEYLVSQNYISVVYYYTLDMRCLILSELYHHQIGIKINLNNIEKIRLEYLLLSYLKIIKEEI